MRIDDKLQIATAVTESLLCSQLVLGLHVRQLRSDADFDRPCR